MIIGTMKTVVSANFNRELVNRIINMYYLNSPYCNIVNDNGIIVEIEHEHMVKLKEAQNNFCENVTLNLLADVDENGKLSNFRLGV